MVVSTLGTPLESKPDQSRILRPLTVVPVNEILCSGVVVFSSADELEARIKQFSPDILLIGDDYKGKPIVGSQYAKKVVFIPRYGGLSSTMIINQR